MNHKCIAERVQNLESWKSTHAYDNNKLPCVALFPCSNYVDKSNELMIRNFDTNLRLSNPSYEKYSIVPLHIGVSDAHFNKCIKSLMAL